MTTDASSDKSVEDAIANLREALIDSGMDPVTADAKLHSLQPPGTGVVGNLADLQRVGAVKAPDPNEPEYVMPPGSEDYKEKVSPEPAPAEDTPAVAPQPETPVLAEEVSGG